MTRIRLDRVLFFLYLFALGALCIVAVVMGHRWALAAAAVGIVSIPVAVWRILRDTQEGRSQRAEGDAQRERERRFRAIADGVAAGLFLTDLKGTIIQTNGAFQSMLGYSREELEGKTPDDFTLRADWAADADLFKEVVAEGLPSYHIEKRFVRKDDRILWGNVTVSLVRDDNGRPLYVAGLVQDITEQRQSGVSFQAVEGLFRQTVDQAAIGVAHTGADGRLMFVNRRLSDMLGLQRSELSGRRLRGLLHPDDVEAAEDGMRRVLANELDEYTAEARFARADGTVFWANLTMSMMREESGATKYGIIMVEDVTERKAAEEERSRLIALEEEARATNEAAAVIRNVVEASPLPIVTLTPAGTIQSWNAAATRTFGWDEHEALGGGVPFDTDPDEAAELRERVLAGESITGLEIRRQRRDGSWLDLSISVAPVSDQRGAITGIMVVYDDITDRKRAERDLEQARDQALESSRLKSEFLATMSHEIRTPMNGIIGTMELLQDTPVNAEQQEYVQIVSESAQSLLAIINDILDFSKLEAEKLVLDAADFDAVSVVEGAAELMAAAARDKGLALVTRVDPTLPLALRGDPLRLRQILLNLIGNSVKFTQRGEVIVTAERERDEHDAVVVRFSVADTGIGLSAEARKGLFQPFVQADGSTTRKYGGTGLGLAICKRLAEAMGGHIGVESTEGEGSTFWFTARFTVASRSTVASVRPQFKDVRALIVDPSESSRNILVSMLASWGVAVDQVSSGREAMGRLKMTIRNPYHLVISEGRLPDMDGLDLGRAVKSDLALREIPLVMLTSFDERGRGATAVRSGFAAYLTKPVKQAQLLDAISSIVSPQEGMTVQLPEAASVAPAQPAAMASVVSQQVPPRETATRKQRGLILLVEDNPNNQLMALRQLEKLGQDVQIVSNGLQAVKALTLAHRYDLVFMDCQMPEMDGYDASRAVRSAEVKSGRHVPIIALTANAMGGDREACVAAGMDDYIAKPVTRDMFQQALDKWLPGEPADSGNAALAG